MKKKKTMLLLTSVLMTGVSLYGCGNASYNKSASDSAVSGGAAERPIVNDNISSNNRVTEAEQEVFDLDYNDGFAADRAVASSDSADTLFDGDFAIDEGEMPVPAEGSFAGEDFSTEEYSAIEEKGYSSVANTPLSTFSVDVDTASYSNLRRMIEDGYTLDEIPQGAVRIEEMLNYFSYDYNLPKGTEPFGVTTIMGDCPWNADAKLLQIGLKTQEIDFSEAPASNLVFLLDVSGSMYTEDKLPLLQKSFCLLTEELTQKDRVSIVTYAGNDEVVLKGVDGSKKSEITNALNSLTASGSTNGAKGIETAYALAENYFIEGGNNRVILATDGDLNVGTTSESELQALITDKKESGVFLSVLGFGTGNIKDNKMETLADYGNGNYAYIDSFSEAKKVLVEEMGATLVTVAKDVKIQIEFNPAYVKGYRLLGYENRALAAEDFDDDKKDAGEIGAGHMVTALYEIIPVTSAQEIDQTDLKYQDKKASVGTENGEWLNLKIRYKEPDKEESKLCEYPVTEEVYQKEPTQDFSFAAAVAEFGLIVRDSQYKKDASFENVRALLKLVDTESDDYKDEFAYLVKKLQKASQ